MKLHPDAQTSLNTVTAYGEGWLEINARRYENSILVMPEGTIQTSPVASFEALDEAFFGHLAAMEPELVILGTGTRQKFPHPRLSAALSARRIGLESMATPAAARTYNILMVEGRKVLAVFLLDKAAAPGGH